MVSISCHILDTAAGRPAAGIKCTLSRIEDGEAVKQLVSAETNVDGRVKEWNTTPDVTPGIYKIRFETGNHFAATFFPYIDVTFQIPSNPDNHYHIPLLLSGHSYTTYRGS